MALLSMKAMLVRGSLSGVASDLSGVQRPNPTPELQCQPPGLDSCAACEHVAT